MQQKRTLVLYLLENNRQLTKEAAIYHSYAIFRREKTFLISYIGMRLWIFVKPAQREKQLVFASNTKSE